MKRISLILLITTYFVTINAQDYRNFPTSNENPLWVMKTTFPHFEENDDVYCNYIGMIGDTTINSKDYSKIYYLSDTIVDVNYTIINYYGALREDSKKIFLVNANEQKEKLVFDFNKKINDTILFDSTTIPPTPVLLEKIDTVIINGLNYIGYSTACGDKWIAGIGNIRWTNFEICPPLPDNGSYTGLYSFKLDDTIIYGKNCNCDIAKRRYDTMSFVKSSCTTESEMDYNFKYSGDTLIFYGVIEANCGGTHLLLYNINVDTINLHRLDTGELEDCMCLYEFEAKFANCTKDKYRVLLDDEYGNGIDTIINKTTSLMKPQLIDNTIIYPNPTIGLVSIDLKNCFTGKVQIKIYDHSGKLIHSGQDILAEKNIEMDISFLQTGIYIMRIFGEKNSRSLKLIKE